MSIVIGFLAILGPLVVVHEFGHYVFARLFRVKAEVFSIGFGPKIWGKVWGETEWRVSAIPLGGYVKLLGEDPEVELPPELQARALQRQKAWKRFLIFFGGPLFNFLFAIVVFMVILVVGEPHVASVVGRVVRDSQAEKAGFRSRDRILAVDGKVVRRFDEVAAAISEAPGRKVLFQISRPGVQEPLAIEATPGEQEGYSIYGETTRVGEIDGLLPNARGTQLAISDPASRAAVSGLRTGKWIVELNGGPVKTWEEVEAAYARAAAGSELAVATAPEEPAEGAAPREVSRVSLGRAKGGRLDTDLGLRSSELFVEKVVDGSPAQKAGLRPGDRLIGVGNAHANSFFEFKDSVQSAGARAGDGKPIHVRWERDGKTMEEAIVPTASQSRDPALKKTVEFTIGVVPMLAWSPPETVLERVWNPFLLVGAATVRMVQLTWRNVVSLKKLVTREVSLGTLGGPILIGKIAGDSLQRGPVAFLVIMAMLSVGLGVLNLLPIPVLDGGHLMLLAIESVRGRPLTLRQMEIVQQVGLSLVLLLMVIVIRNDIARLPVLK